MIILLLGPPGAGKGTQGERIAQRLGIPKLATGDVLRAAVRDRTPEGLRAREYMDRGELVPDAVILGIMREALERPDAARGVVLDGVVRTVPQAEGLERLLAELGRNVDAVVLFDIDEAELIQRLSTRTVCEVCQTPYTGRPPGSTCEKGDGGRLVRRKDDEPAAIRKRMSEYRKQTEPVVEWYRRRADGAAGGTRFITIEAVGRPDEITERLWQALRP